jgi:hypothetical protein
MWRIIMNRATVALVVILLCVFGLTNVSARSFKGAVVALVTQRTDFRDLGHAPASLLVSLKLTLTLRNPALYERTLTLQNDPRSAIFHNPISDRDFIRLFAPSATAYNALISQVLAAGLKVVSTTENRSSLTIAGPSALIDRLFQTDIHVVFQSGVGYRYANGRTATMPQQWVGLVSNIDGFDNLASRSAGSISNPLWPKPRITGLLLHTTTYAYDGHFLNGAESTATVQRWLNYAEGAGQKTPDKAVGDGDHCLNTCSVFYADFARMDTTQDPAKDFLAETGFVDCSAGGHFAADDWVLHTTALPCGPSTRTSPSPSQLNGNYGNLTGIGAKFLAYIQGNYSGLTGCCLDSRWNLHDYIFQDTTSTDLYHDTQCCLQTMEYSSDTPFLSAFTAFQTSLVHVNGIHFHNGDPYLSFPNGFADGQTANENGDVTCEFCMQDFGSTHVAGGVCEFCMQNGTEGNRSMYPLFVPYTVNVASDVIGAGHQFINLNEYNGGEGYKPPSKGGHDIVGASVDDRYLLYSTYMLYYQPSDTQKAILWEDFEDHASNSAYNGVFPEQALVGYGTPAIALLTYVPAINGIGLAGCTPSEGDSGGIIPYLIPGTCVHGNYNGTMHWLGMYGQIYPTGSYPSGDIKTGNPASIGSIAFVVNLTTTAQTVPCTWFINNGYTNTTFNHEITIAPTGGDVLHGGALDFTSTAFECQDTRSNPTSIPAQSARFLGV